MEAWVGQDPSKCFTTSLGWWSPMLDYFLASQMQQMAGWAEIVLYDPIQKVLLSSLSKDPLVSLLEAGHFWKHCSSPTFLLIHKVLEAMRVTLGHTGYTQYVPIWNNINFPEVNKRTGFERWTQSVFCITSSTV